MFKKQTQPRLLMHCASLALLTAAGCGSNTTIAGLLDAGFDAARFDVSLDSSRDGTVTNPDTTIPPTDGGTSCAPTEYRAASGCLPLTVCTASQYESTAPTATSNRVCSELTVCTAAQYQMTAPTATSNRVCASLTACSATQYETAAPTATTDRVCATLTVCTSTQYQNRAATATSDRTCADITVCSASEYETTPPTATSNRVCSPLGNCAATEYESTPASGTMNRVCTPLTVCTSQQYQSVAPTPTSDRRCTAVTACTASQYESTAPTAVADRVCMAVSTCTTGQYESAAPTATSDRVCSTVTTCSATEYESAAATATSNRVCTALTTCNSAQYESVAPTATSNRVCSAISDCTASQYQSAAPTATSNRVCTALTVCTASQYETTASTATSDRVCTALTVCTASQYQSTAATATSDRVCTALTVCTASQYQSTAPTATSNRVCTALTVCTASQYQSVAPTATSDRVCTALTVCTASQYQSTAPTATSDRVCTALTVCTASQYQSTAPTATSDRVCTALTVCTASQYESTAPTATSNRVCTALTVCTTAQYESTAPTATSNRVCTACGANRLNCDGAAGNQCEVDTQNNRSNCGACGIVCTATQVCNAGNCGALAAGAVLQTPPLQTTGCSSIEHNTITGDDRGGMALSSTQLFYTGDGATGRFSPVDLSGGTAVTGGTSSNQYDAIFSDLVTQQVYVFGNATGVYNTGVSGGGVQPMVIDRFYAVDGATGARGAATLLSSTFTMPIYPSSQAGIFSGSGRVVVVAGTNAYNVTLPGGVVRDLGAYTMPAHTQCESANSFGVAEYFGGNLYIDYVANGTTVARSQIFPAGATTTLASFTNLSDMCTFTISLQRGRWYWHHEGTSQFRSGDESIGFCNMPSLYHGFALAPEVQGACDITSYNTTLPTNQGGTYPVNAGDSVSCRAWKLAATVCATAPTNYNSSGSNANFYCPISGGFTDPVFGTYCAVANQYSCSGCPGACNAQCAYNPLSLRNCSNQESNQQ